MMTTPRFAPQRGDCGIARCLTAKEPVLPDKSRADTSIALLAGNVEIVARMSEATSGICSAARNHAAAAHAGKSDLSSCSFAAPGFRFAHPSYGLHGDGSEQVELLRSG
jgi:hypothetical protein